MFGSKKKIAELEYKLETREHYIKNLEDTISEMEKDYIELSNKVSDLLIKRKENTDAKAIKTIKTRKKTTK